MTVMQEWETAQDSPEIPVNENFNTLGYAAVYGYNPATSSGLTWGYYGGRWSGFAVAAGTLTLTNSATNYVVVQRSDGAISVSTTTTNWDNNDNYARVYRIVTSGGAATNIYGADFDYRAGDGGIFGSSGGGGGGGFANPMTTLGDIIVGGVSGNPQRLAVGTNGQILTVVSGEPAWAAASGGGGGITLGTAVTASLTAVLFTGIPSDAKRVSLIFNSLSTNGDSAYIVQIGDSGGIETSGYAGATTVFGVSTLLTSDFSSGFLIRSDSSANVHTGTFTLSKLTGNVWVCEAQVARTNSAVSYIAAGAKQLSDTLTQIRITTTNGTDNFDSGTVNISWET